MSALKHDADRRRPSSSGRRSQDTGRGGGAPRQTKEMTDKKGFPLRLDPEIYDALQRWASSEFRSVNGQIEYLLRCALQDAGRLPGSDRDASGGRQCKEEARSIAPDCRRRFSRRRRVTCGSTRWAASCSSRPWCSSWPACGAASFSADARKSPSGTSRLFASERIVTAGDVIQLRKRGGGDDHRITAHYRYTARGRELTGETTLRRSRTRTICRGLAGRGLVSRQPNPRRAGSMATRPRPQPSWPATAVPLACGVCCTRAHSGWCAVSRICSPTVGRQWRRSRRSRRNERTRGPSGWCTTSGPR